MQKHQFDRFIELTYGFLKGYNLLDLTEKQREDVENQKRNISIALFIKRKDGFDTTEDEKKFLDFFGCECEKDEEKLRGPIQL